MWKFIKSLFSSKPSFHLGVLQNPPVDSRTISSIAFQAPITLPDDYNTITPIVDYQDGETCVGESIKEVKETFDLGNGKYIPLSADDLYNQCKAIDGLPNTSGTYPLVGAKVITGSGVASQAVYKTGDQTAVTADRANHKLGGFASVNTDFDSVCQAIFQNKVVTAAFDVDNNWYLGIITRVLKSIGGHYTLLHGFNRPAGIIRGMNSWGIAWIGRVTAFFDASLAMGHFDMRWSDYSGNVSQIFMFTDSIPQPIIYHVKSLDYAFLKPMQFGQQSYDVLQLQKRMIKEGMTWPADQAPTGYYGTVTAAAVLHYQLVSMIITNPLESKFGHLCGPKTIASLNGQIGLDLISAIIQVESGGNLYAVGDLDLSDHAYGCMQIRRPVCDDINKKYGLTLQSKDMLGNKDLSIDTFNKYIAIYEPQGTNEAKARLWNGGPFWRNNQSATDAYWKNVSSMISVDL